MKTLPMPTKRTRRKSRITVISAVLFRHRGDTAWRLSVIANGKRSEFTDLHTTNETAARELARLMVRELTRQPAASSQQPAARQSVLEDISHGEH